MTAAPREGEQAAGQVPPMLGFWLTLLLAVGGGIVVANLYYAQPLLAPISEALGIAPWAAGIAMTVTQVGYGLGLLLVVPLGDRFENRRLIVATLLVVAGSLLAAGLAANAPLFLAACFSIGVSASVAQILVPYASHLAAPADRGRVVGNVMSGVLLGMMLARPIASLMADAHGWRAVFLGSCAVVTVLALVMALVVPRRTPSDGFRYRTLFRSLRALLVDHPVLRRRAAIQFCLFGAFTLFWTVIPLLLASSAFGMTQKGIAIFALLGVTGAGAAPLVGWASDRGWGRLGALAGILASVVAFALCLMAGAGHTGLVLLVVAGILLDCGVACSLVVGQRTILTLGSEGRSRVNGLFFSIFYSGGAIGSAVGAWAMVVGGWTLAMGIGLAVVLVALALHLTERATPVSPH